jgi:hypothetical protein
MAATIIIPFYDNTARFPSVLSEEEKGEKTNLLVIVYD